MPKNKGKGGKNRKRGKNEADDEKRELVFKEDRQEYGQVLRMLGNGHRRHQAPPPHPRQDAQEGLDRRWGYNPGRIEGLPGRQGLRHLSSTPSMGCAH
ncbi:hypothetical protein Sjap_005194 [Stephania japonica]|uniref:Uncharacterized protein n=1 Tax=Stephania japonica TaxID=461633 RepID=A0AAP0K3I0_9MAGN